MKSQGKYLGPVVGSSTAMAVGGTTLLHCSGPGGEDRAAHLAIPSGAIAPSLNLNSTLNSTLNSALGGIGTAATDGTIPTWPSTLWQYPTATAAGNLRKKKKIIGIINELIR